MSEKETIEYFKGMTKVQISTLKEDISEIKEDVKAMRIELKGIENYKNKLIGISIAASFIFSGVMAYLINYFKN